MYSKAQMNGDAVAARKIRYTTNPREIKKIGQSIKINDDDNWNKVKRDIMLNLVRAKFTQNVEKQQELLSTGNRTLGETGKDRIYAVGLPFTHPNILNKDAWTAESELGKALETVRAELRE